MVALMQLFSSILNMQMRGDENCLKNSATAVYHAISEDIKKESKMYAVKKMKVDEAREEECLTFHYLGHEAGMSSDTITKMAESVPGFMDKLEQFFVKYCMEKDGEDGKLRVRALKKPNLPTDDDNLSSVVRDMFGAMKVKVENSEL
eukprot:scaffold13793_cov95-Skeletonema_dohrnii-CCMP3373.AAC.2